jgi:hypothetical protein
VVQTPASKLVYVHPMMLCWISWCLSSCVYPQYGDSVSLREMFQTDVYYVYTYIYIYTYKNRQTFDGRNNDVPFNYPVIPVVVD